jgi:hypothetical protein
MLESDDDAEASNWVVVGPTTEKPNVGSVIETVGGRFCPNAAALVTNSPKISRAAGRDTL